MSKSVLITGANTGLGREAARQYAQNESIGKIYLACRNLQKAEVAKQALKSETGRDIFHIVQVDLSNLNSVKQAVVNIDGPIDILVMNAGGIGGPDWQEKNEDGVTKMFSMNVLGHVLFLDKLIESKKLIGTAIYAGSEAARGVPKMGIKKPKLKDWSKDEFVSVIDGSFFKKGTDPLDAYGVVKYVATQYISNISKENPHLKIFTISPGSTSGTDVGKSLKQPMKFVFTVVGPKLLPLFGLMHSLDKGASRYVEASLNPELKSGGFYASKISTLTGPIVDQTQYWDNLKDSNVQKNAFEAVRSFITSENTH